MTPKRLYFVLIGAIFLLFVAIIVGAYGINSLLGTRADKLTDLKAKSQALDKEQLSLVDAKKDVAKYSSLQQIAQSVVPEDKSQAEAVREIVNLSAAHGISLASITFPASSLGSTGAGSTSTSSTTSTSTVSPTVNANALANSSASKLSQLQRVPNIPGVYALQITVQSDSKQPVSYDSFVGFLNELEHNRRTAQISSISLQPKTNSDLLTFTLVLNEYIKP
ncbi:MAG TPA: hypothetical protein VHA05_00635 [Candidatus Saccharimonadales bacterium]|nr:hypothetical protein [Candidatus Saccharimonadales bacterium]